MARTLYDRINEIKTKHLSPQSVTGEKVANSAIEEKHIKDGSVTKRKIADGIIGKDEIANGAVTTEKIAVNAVTADKIAANAVTAEKVAAGAITGPKIANGAITTDKIANGAVTRDKVADQSVGTADLQDGAVTNPKIAANAVTQGKIAPNSIGGSELIDGAVAERELSSAAVTPPKVDAVNSPTDGQALTYETASGRFKYATPSAVITRPIVPPLDTPEIGDGKVTPAKLSFTPVSRPLVPPATPAEMEDRFSIAQNLLLFSNLSGASVPNTEIDLAPYVPAGTKYAVVVMTHAGANTILFGYKAQFYAKPTVDPAPLYRLDTAAKDFTNYLTVLVPLDANRKFVTSVYRDGVTTAAELYLMGYVR